MIGIRRHYEKGVYRANEESFAWLPLKRPTVPVGVLHLHGYGGGAIVYKDDLYGNIPLKLAERGAVSFAADLGTMNTYGGFGNDDTMTAIGLAITYMRNTFGIVGGVHLFGGSMGSLNALNYAKRFPADVLSINMPLPLTDLADFHDNNRGGYATTVEAAYGGLAGYNAEESNRNPIEWTGQLPNIPKRLWYSTDDPLIPVATVNAFVAATGATAYSLGAVGHYAAGLIDPDFVADKMLNGTF